MEKKDSAPRLERRSMVVRELRMDDDARKIEGYASVFNEETDIGGMFREVVRPGAFKRAIKEKQDVRALWNHNPDHIIGRTKAGTLSLQEDKRGLWISIDPPDTQFSRDLMESIKRGDVDQMSFAFRAVEEQWTERKGEPSLRELVDLDLFDVSPVTYPAYEGTQVGLRLAESVYQEYVNSREEQALDAEDETEPVRQVPSDIDHVVDEILNL
jgi:HK97 family phage prohead protease